MTDLSSPRGIGKTEWFILAGGIGLAVAAAVAAQLGVPKAQQIGRAHV